MRCGNPEFDNTALNSKEDYERALHRCSLCAEILATKPVDPESSDERVRPKPIVRALKHRPVMLVGQAPGLTEYRSGRPFSGQAGGDIRKFFAECGCDEAAFEQIVHTSAVVKCFPGSALKKRRNGDGFRREDLKPSRKMQKNCRPYLDAQLRLVQPKLLVLLGSLALETYVELREGRRRKTPLADYVGMVDAWDGITVVPLGHTSGGSFWLNDPDNRARQEEAKRHLEREIAPFLPRSDAGRR